MALDQGLSDHCKLMLDANAPLDTTLCMPICRRSIEAWCLGTSGDDTKRSARRPPGAPGQHAFTSWAVRPRCISEQQPQGAGVWSWAHWSFAAARCSPGTGITLPTICLFSIMCSRPKTGRACSPMVEHALKQSWALVAYVKRKRLHSAPWYTRCCSPEMQRVLQDLGLPSRTRSSSLEAHRRCQSGDPGIKRQRRRMEVQLEYDGQTTA